MASQRESVRNFGAAVLVVGTLYGCAPKTPEVQYLPSPVIASETWQVRIEDTSNWLSRVIVADRSTLYSFDDVGNYQCTPIGLDKLYIMNDSNSPLVAVGGVGNTSDVIAVNNAATVGGIGFQRITEPFAVNITLARRAIDQTRVTSQAIVDFFQYSFRVMNRAAVGLLETPLGFYVVVDRPPQDSINALVLQEGIFQYQGRPSPQSCIKVRYGFDFTPPIPFQAPMRGV